MPMHCSKCRHFITRVFGRIFFIIQEINSNCLKNSVDCRQFKTRCIIGQFYAAPFWLLYIETYWNSGIKSSISNMNFLSGGLLRKPHKRPHSPIYKPRHNYVVADWLFANQGMLCGYVCNCLVCCAFVILH